MIGDLLEDVVVWPAGTVRRGTDNAATVSRSRGGSGANVAGAVVAAGGHARFIGRVGDDELGGQLCDRLAGRGVDVLVQRAGRTGAVVVIVDADGERTMFPDRAAAGELDMIDPEWLVGTGVLHVPAYALLTSVAPVAQAAAVVRRSGGRVTVDLSAASLIEAIGATQLRAMLAELQPTIVFANSDEAGALGVDVTGVDVTGVDVTGVDVTGVAWPITVIKRGGLPALVVRVGGAVGRPATGTGLGEAANSGPGATGGHRSPSVVEVPAEDVDDVRDSTGAGDAFAGAFLVDWLGGRSIEAACAAGHRGAAAVLTSSGAGW